MLNKIKIMLFIYLPLLTILSCGFVTNEIQYKDIFFPASKIINIYLTPRTYVGQEYGYVIWTTRYVKNIQIKWYYKPFNSSRQWLLVYDSGALKVEFKNTGNGSPVQKFEMFFLPYYAGYYRLEINAWNKWMYDNRHKNTEAVYRG